MKTYQCNQHNNFKTTFETSQLQEFCLSHQKRRGFSNQASNDKVLERSLENPKGPTGSLKAAQDQPGQLALTEFPHFPPALGGWKAWKSLEPANASCMKSLYLPAAPKVPVATSMPLFWT